VVVSPLARRLAVNNGVDLAGIAGSGPHGRINAKDVAKAIDARPPPSLDRAATREETIGEVHRSRPHTVLPIDGMRRTIAKRLVVAKATIPHFYLSADVAIDRLSRIRDEINAGAPKTADGSPTYRLSHTDFMVKALALALRDVPRANAIWAGEGILAFEHSDVAIAVALADGLL